MNSNTHHMQSAKAMPGNSDQAALDKTHGFQILCASSDISALEKTGKEEASAVLSNSNVRIVFKCPGE